MTPSYNQGQFVEETIRSVLLQGYPDLEYIVVDGGSTDGSVDVIRKYERWLAHWVSERDRGQSDAVNKGWARCTGDVFGWLNSDDVYSSAAMANQVAFLLRPNGADLVYANAVWTDEQSNVTGTLFGRPFSYRELLRATIPMQPTVFFRRSVYEQCGGLSLDFRFTMDSEFWTRAAARGFAFAFNPVVIATYRLHSTSKTVAQMDVKYADWRRLVETRARDDRERRTLLDALDLQEAMEVLPSGQHRRSLSLASRSFRSGPQLRHCMYVGTLLLSLVGVSNTRIVDWWTWRKSQSR